MFLGFTNVNTTVRVTRELIKQHRIKAFRYLILEQKAFDTLKDELKQLNVFVTGTKYFN